MERQGFGMDTARKRLDETLLLVVFLSWTFMWCLSMMPIPHSMLGMPFILST